MTIVRRSLRHAHLARVFMGRAPVPLKRSQGCLPKYFQNSFADSLAANSLNTTDLFLFFGSLIRPFSCKRFKTSQSCPFHVLMVPCSVNDVRYRSARTTSSSFTSSYSMEPPRRDFNRPKARVLDA